MWLMIIEVICRRDVPCSATFVSSKHLRPADALDVTPLLYRMSVLYFTLPRRQTRQLRCLLDLWVSSRWIDQRARGTAVVR